ncbi:AAA-ATPase [Stenotrophomonas phage Piffle]|uniref:AAA domain-containing protein n=2 Tax=Pokkenvirus TaxID=2842972 RepID=A0AAE7WM86_9CAUD|nr:hypothetical protein PP761_gp66 [Stenotrophomonas phage Paxi]YP_010659475.1 AAA-ATPase [Stenotrophomonas phage Piffle]QYW01829.1 hypothetical protein CPT_Paxi_063 [Stenotrophomonas phage Paxi]QYW01918.1 AAA-ATPase [Stenotrophomonas phage Piffle]
MSTEEEDLDIEINDQLVLISGQSATGKSASLRNIRNQSRWVYMGTEAGKRLPFRNQFNSIRITDPYQVFAYIDECIANPDEVDGIIIDSITFLMDMYETQYVIGSANTMAAWGAYQQFFKQLMGKIAQFGKPVILTAHTLTVYNETTMTNETSVPIKGALKNNGIEAYFSTVVSTKKVTLKELEKYSSGLLEITEEEKELGFKYVFQTRITKSTTGERIRSPMGMFDRNQTYIDNDAQALIDHLTKFYNEAA